MNQVPEFRFSHVGVNGQTRQESERFLRFLQEAFHIEDAIKLPTSHFIAEKKIEMMNEGGRGTLGHLAFYTPDMQKAIDYLQEQGYELDFEDVRLDENGNIRLIYLKQEFNGFAIHLTTKK